MNFKEWLELTGCIFYGSPDELTEQQIDPLIRKAVFRINESRWVFTGESCQGHPDATEYPWAGNTRPMLRLITRNEDMGRMLGLLLEAATWEEDFLPKCVCYELYPYPRAASQNRGWTELLVYIPANTVYARNKGIETFERFAELLNKVSG